MHTKSENGVLVSLSTPILTRSTRRDYPAVMTLGECVREAARAEPPDPGERRIIEQIRREIAGARFDILVVFDGGKTELVKPDTPLRDIAIPRKVSTANGIEELWTAQVEVQSYAPVGL